VDQFSEELKTNFCQLSSLSFTFFLSQMKPLDNSLDSLKLQKVILKASQLKVNWVAVWKHFKAIKEMRKWQIKLLHEYIYLSFKWAVIYSQEQQIMTSTFLSTSLKFPSSTMRKALVYQGIVYTVMGWLILLSCKWRKDVGIYDYIP